MSEDLANSPEIYRTFYFFLRFPFWHFDDFWAYGIFVFKLSFYINVAVKKWLPGTHRNPDKSHSKNKKCDITRGAFAGSTGITKKAIKKINSIRIGKSVLINMDCIKTHFFTFIRTQMQLSVRRSPFLFNRPVEVQFFPFDTCQICFNVFSDLIYPDWFISTRIMLIRFI